MQPQELKKGVDYIGNTVSFFCHDGKGNYVLAKRSNNARDEKGHWDTGGGGVEFGSTVEETLLTEIREEYCTDVLDFEFLGYRDVLRQQDEKKTHWIGLHFKVLVDRTKVKIGEPNKFDDIGWFRLDNLPSPPHSQLLAAIDQFRDRLD